jgi:predicted RNA-binding protein with PUA-like domain
MAFSADGFATIAASKAGNAPSIYSYKTADTQATVNTAGYFNSIASLLKVGDVIFVYDSKTPSLVLTYVNQVTAAGVVDIADGTTVSATDTD